MYFFVFATGPCSLAPPLRLLPSAFAASHRWRRARRTLAMAATEHAWGSGTPTNSLAVAACLIYMGQEVFFSHIEFITNSINSSKPIWDKNHVASSRSMSPSSPRCIQNVSAISDIKQELLNSGVRKA